MKELKHQLKLSKEDYYDTHLSIINCLLPKKVTPTEMKVLSTFMSLEGHIAEYRFGPSAKKLVMQKLGLSPAGLSNHMKELVNKQFLIKRDGVISILPILWPEPDEQFYNLKLTNNEHS